MEKAYDRQPVHWSPVGSRKLYLQRQCQHRGQNLFPAPFGMGLSELLDQKKFAQTDIFVPHKITPCPSRSGQGVIFVFFL